ncbi:MULTISPECIES: 2Fe-2S iron-sulfur cluster-binding protein [Paenibacillus]|uniref:2Fe-2S iron-sulfur cluster-binding protein n=1 Tax=Paenibacillus TaxID=44249 RepID=UPI0004356BE7|nr:MULTISPECIES: 2Fe-2S iron-sulfur cluster-binding protein [Paenibacillus]CDN42831.1 Ferredoxin [Paenibacillus sp. P22]
MMAEATFWPSGKTVKVRPGTTLLSAARQAGLSVPVRCDGKAACLMCKMSLLPDHGDQGLSRLSEVERRKLGTDGHQRLGCQSRVTGNCHVSIPESPLKAAVRRQLERQAAEDDDDWLRGFRS